MRVTRLLAGLLVLFPFTGLASAREPAADTALYVPLGGNAWRVDKDTLGGKITNDGITEWTNGKAEFVAYLRFAKTGKFKLWLDAKAVAGEAKLSVSCFGSDHSVKVSGSAFSKLDAGEWEVRDTGYVAIHIKGLSKTGTGYAGIIGLHLSGSAVDAQTAYVKNNEGDFFYWGRRGPSVHLSYEAPAQENVEWFYNEVTVPPGNDVLHSYFMACGFAEGYFGMQVNSPTERHILFSVWSPFETDDPGKIPDAEKIMMLKKGPDVHTGEFGSEGSGGQSYLLYNWKAGNTYTFLMQAKPDGNNRTVYTAWFFAPEVGTWHLIASFSRPKTNTYLKHLHSFLENFEPEQGTVTRKVLFTNEWVADEHGNWTELTRARFTVDNTGAKGYRMDYAGGVDGNFFYLKNCGFFSEYTVRNKWFERATGGKKPDVDLDGLP
jgi:hypothetical protein